MKKPFDSLRRVMRYYDLTAEELGAVIGLGRTAMSMRLNGRQAFTVTEAYAIMDLFHIDSKYFTDLFPKGGYANAADAQNN